MSEKLFEYNLFELQTIVDKEMKEQGYEWKAEAVMPIHKMPNNCFACEMLIDFNGMPDRPIKDTYCCQFMLWENRTLEEVTTSRSPDCPLIELNKRK